MDSRSRLREWRERRSVAPVAQSDSRSVPQLSAHNPDDGLGWSHVLKHAWGHIKESWRVALVGGVVTFVLPPLFEWWRTYHFSHKGLDEVTGGSWEWSVLAVVVWLVLVAAWHVLCAPMAHAREIIKSLHGHHARELERVREDARREASPSVERQYVQQQTNIIVASAEEASTLVKKIPLTRLATQPSAQQPARPDASPRAAEGGTPASS